MDHPYSALQGEALARALREAMASAPDNFAFPFPAGALRGHERLLEKDALPPLSNNLNVTPEEWEAATQHTLATSVELEASLSDGWLTLFFTDRVLTEHTAHFRLTYPEWRRLYAALDGPSRGFRLGERRELYAGGAHLVAVGSMDLSFPKDHKLDTLDRLLAERFHGKPDLTPGQLLEQCLAQFQAANHTGVDAHILDSIPLDAETIPILAAALRCKTVGVVLAAIELLGPSLGQAAPDILAGALMPVLDDERFWVREKAETALGQLDIRSQPTIDGLVEKIRGAENLRSLTRLLRALSRTGGRAGAGVAVVANRLPAMTKARGQCWEIEEAVVAGLEVLEAAPDHWSESRGAVEFLCQNYWKRAQRTRELLQQAMPIPWEQDLVVPELTSKSVDPTPEARIEPRTAAQLKPRVSRGWFERLRDALRGRNE